MRSSPYSLSVPVEQVILCRTVGVDLLKFLLSASSERLRQHYCGLSGALSPSQVDVLEDCADLLERLAERYPLDDSGLCLLFLEHLSQRDSHGYTRAETFRRRSGGVPPRITGHDELLRLLLTVGLDVYPLLIGNVSGLGPRGLHDNAVGRPFVRAVRHHPDYARLAEACRSDPVLGPDAGTRRYTWQHRPIGVVVDPFLVEPEALPLEVLNGAVGQIATSPDPPSLRAFFDAIRLSLHNARRAIRGQAIALRYCFAFSGIALSEPGVVQTPWGVLFPANVIGRGFRPFSASADVLFVGAEPATASGSHLSQPHGAPEDVRQRPGELIPLAALLASPNGQLAAPEIEWAAAIPPLGGLQSWWSPLRVLSEWKRSPAAVDVSSLAEWSRILHMRFASSLETARSRALRAVAERIYREDALVDAVTVWENILGGGGETVFRVTGAGACMLEEDSTARPLRQKTLKRIYSLRSDIVHGNPPEKSPRLWEDLGELSDAAVLTAVELLRALFLDFPHLVAIESAGRAEALLLGVAAREVSDQTQR